ncbi:MAG: EVE domain-containing protein [Gemmatimonadales bacterium]
MPNYWILKTEPSSYSFADLERERRAVWDGVKNPVALKHMRGMRPGDPIMIYHTGDEKAVVGLAVVKSEAYPDPKKKDPRLLVIDIAAERPLPSRVSLATIKADKTFAALALVRQGRLSVVPVPPPQWARLLKLAGVS